MQISPSNRTRLSGLDSARGLAIILVVIFHYTHDRILGGVANIIVGPFGLGGVTLFFMLSGFLIERHLSRDSNLARYASRRIFRIMPAYFGCLAVILAIEPFLPNAHHWTLREIAVNVILLQDVLSAPLILGVIWTLLIEIKYYALAPLIMRAGPVAVRLAPWAAIGANLIIVAMRVEASNLLTYLIYCLIGMQFGPWQRGEMSNWALGLVVAFAAAATLRFSSYFAIGLAIFVVLDAVIMAFALTRQRGVPPLPFIGKISYSWYLYHAAIGYPIIALAPTGIGVTIILATAASLFAAWLSFVALERPMINFGLRCEKYLPFQRTLKHSESGRPPV